MQSKIKLLKNTAAFDGMLENLPELVDENIVPKALSLGI